MKLTKLMLSAALAVFALVSCNKVETTPDPTGTSPKTVTLSFENIVLTKGEAGSKITDGSPVQVNDLKIFLTDEAFTIVYPAYNATQTESAKSYWSAEDLATLGAMPAAEFHYVDHKCTRVVAVANMGDIDMATLKAFTKDVAEQQDQKSLVLIDFEPLTKTSQTHTVADGKYTEVFKADLTLKPAISRFELDGFSVKFNNPSAYSKVEVIDVAFNHYFPQVAYSTTSGVPNWLATGTLVHPIADYTNAASVYEWFAVESNNGWFRDSYSNQVVITPDDPATPAKENVADVPSPRAYHFFSGNEMPTMLIKLLVDGNPAYVYTDTFKDASGVSLTALEAGKIYRMSAAGVASNTGTVEIPEDVLDPVNRCLDITVQVTDWQVELVTPEF